MPVGTRRDERVNVRLSKAASDDLIWLAEKLGVPKTTATSVAIAIGVKTLQRHLVLTPVELQQRLVAAGALPDPLADPAETPSAPVAVKAHHRGSRKIKKRR